MQFTFLICSERSGSNFVTSLMNGHPAVCGPPPTHLFRLFATNRANYGDLANDDHWQALGEDLVLNFETILGTWHTQLSAEELLLAADERSVAALLGALYRREAERDGASHIFVKENQTYRFVPFLLAGFPGCRFVWVVRDPRDVAVSWLATSAMPGGVEKAVEVWLQDQRATQEIYGQLQDSQRILRLRYEDLVEHTVPTLERLTAFLDLPYEPVMLNFHQAERTRLNARRIEAWTNIGQPVLKGNTGKFRDALDEPDQRYVELACGKLMRIFGYAPESLDGEVGEEFLATQLDRLRPQLSTGRAAEIAPREQEIRERRLASIRRVLGRRL